MWPGVLSSGFLLSHAPPALVKDYHTNNAPDRFSGLLELEQGAGEAGGQVLHSVYTDLQSDMSSKPGKVRRVSNF